jgi:peptide/nickel transport system ATP-binding protein
MSRSLLRVRDLSVEFGPAGKGVRVLDRVGFDMAAGDCIGIVGESGSGKSVMSLSLLRLIPEPPGRIVEGSIEFDGVDLLTLPLARMPDIRGKEIAMIFQEPMSALNPVMTIGEQISEAIFLHESADAAQRRVRVLDMLQLVGIPDAESRYASYPH